MTEIPFDVNDAELRRMFFTQLLPATIETLEAHTPPLWGKMSAQQMLEHMVWTFECSTGMTEVACTLSPERITRAKTFLYDNRHLPQGFKNPALGESPAPPRFAGVPEARAVLLQELARYLNHFNLQPATIHVHPIFGPLGAEEWDRSHFKHCYHHLMQFGLIPMPR